MINEIVENILNNQDISYNQALSLVNEDTAKLSYYADKIRNYFCKDTFDMCAIINAKSGKCCEDCKFCAQSAYYNTDILEYNLLDKNKIIESALYNAEKGVLRFSIVTSGRLLNDEEVDKLADIIKEIKSKSNISICASLGLLSYNNFKKLKEAGLERVHNNLETAESNFHNICSTHTFQDKVNAVKLAKSIGLSVCSGTIIGLGESMSQRIELAFSLKELNISSIPINILNPIKNTPFEHNKILDEDEIIKTCAIYRFILPKAFLRLAGGRIFLKDKGEKAFLSGINAVITGDMLTTNGFTIESDMKLINKIGYKVELINE